MKKMISLMLAMLLCLTMSAAATSVPSMDINDLYEIEVTVENPPENPQIISYMGEGTGFVLYFILEEDREEYPKEFEIYDAELKKLVEAADIETYFGEVSDFDGNVVDLKEAVELDIEKGEVLHVNEFCLIGAYDYKVEYGKVTAMMRVPTFYEDGEKLVIMIGFATFVKDEATEELVQVIEWVAYEGVVLSAENQGLIRVKDIEPETVLRIQDEKALLAIVSD